MGIYAILAWQKIRATRSIAFPVFVPRGNPSVKYGVHRYLSTPSPYPSYFRISPRPLLLQGVLETIVHSPVPCP